jgi:hypothetical protein
MLVAHRSFGNFMNNPARGLGIHTGLPAKAQLIRVYPRKSAVEGLALVTAVTLQSSNFRLDFAHTVKRGPLFEFDDSTRPVKTSRQLWSGIALKEGHRDVQNSFSNLHAVHSALLFVVRLRR